VNVAGTEFLSAMGKMIRQATAWEKSRNENLPLPS
jgi:hypothetical protein